MNDSTMLILTNRVVLYYLICETLVSTKYANAILQECTKYEIRNAAKMLGRVIVGVEC